MPCTAEQTLEFAEHRHCPNCGTRIKKWPSRLFLRSADLPVDLDVFGVGDSLEIKGFDNVIVTQRFKDAVEKLGLTNIRFETVELV